jgi:hypothetical protein
MCRTLAIICHIDLFEQHLTFRAMIITCDNNIDDYIWLLRQESRNTLQAWHPISRRLHASICLNKVFDRIGRVNEQLPHMNRQESTYDDNELDASSTMSDMSISSFLIHDRQLWIGTSSGILFVFDYTLTLNSNRSCMSTDRCRSRSLSSIDDIHATSQSCSNKSRRIRSKSYANVFLFEQVRSYRQQTNKSRSTHVITPQLNLVFKGKIADTPVKSISRIQYVH